MPFLEWDDELDIGVNKMNMQHKGLLNLMNKLFDRDQGNAPKEELVSLVEELKKLTIEHFRDEEAYMVAIQYDESAFRRHKLNHERLLKRFEGHLNSFKNGEENLSDNFFDFLKLWLSSHIKGIDKTGYAQHAINTGKAA